MSKRALCKEPPPYAALVLDVVERIPRGFVMTYGDVAEWLGSGGPRAVGQVMATYGSQTNWHRVVRAGGWPAPGHEAEALALLRRDRVAMHQAGTRVDLSQARWNGQV